MAKSTNYIYSEKLYKTLNEEQKKRINLDLLYNAVCCFHDMEGEKIADMLMALSDEDFTKLEKSLANTRDAVNEMQKAVCLGAGLDSYFASPDVADILFYQMSNDLPIC